MLGQSRKVISFGIYVELKQNNAMEVDIKELEKQRVNELYFRRNYPSVNVDTSMEALIERISNQNFVPVVDDRGVFIGIITRKDVITYLSTKKKETSASEDFLDVRLSRLIK